ncbi:MAG: hypothetical protein U5J63_00370 [Fodinibius sp.]|nr:hypothetical protein [Fodinibius sp.]
MDIKSPENNFQDISYGNAKFNELVEHLASTENRDTHHLSLFLGLYQPEEKGTQRIGQQT